MVPPKSTLCPLNWESLPQRHAPTRKTKEDNQLLEEHTWPATSVHADFTSTKQIFYSSCDTEKPTPQTFWIHWHKCCQKRPCLTHLQRQIPPPWPTRTHTQTCLQLHHARHCSRQQTRKLKLPQPQTLSHPPTQSRVLHLPERSSQISFVMYIIY